MFRSTLLLTSILVIYSGTTKEEPIEENSGRGFSSPLDTFGLKKSYKFYCSRISSLTFLQAWRKCLDNGTHFATIESAAEEQLFNQGLSRLVTVQAWIGATDLGRPGSFVWLENRRPLGYGINYVPWSAGQPATVSGTACVYALKETSGLTKWRSVPCESAYNGCYACQSISLQ